MRFGFLILCMLLLPFCALHAQTGQGGGDTSQTFTPDWDWPPEQFMANELAYGLGGLKGWQNTKWNIAFDVSLRSDGKEGSRFHYDWNRSKNECVVEGKTPDGRAWRVHFSDVAGMKGTATVDSMPVLESELPGILKMAYGRFRADCHALFLPFELLDPGVSLTIGTDTSIDGATYSILEASFARDSALNFTSNYWIHVSSQTKQIDGYRYLTPAGTPIYYKLDLYRQFGPLRLATRRRSGDGRHLVMFENIKVTGNEPQ